MDFPVHRIAPTVRRPSSSGSTPHPVHGNTRDGWSPVERLWRHLVSPDTDRRRVWRGWQPARGPTGPAPPAARPRRSPPPARPEPSPASSGDSASARTPPRSAGLPTVHRYTNTGSRRCEELTTSLPVTRPRSIAWLGSAPQHPPRCGGRPRPGGPIHGCPPSEVTRPATRRQPGQRVVGAGPTSLQHHLGRARTRPEVRPRPAYRPRATRPPTGTRGRRLQYLPRFAPQTRQDGHRLQLSCRLRASGRDDHRLHHDARQSAGHRRPPAAGLRHTRGSSVAG
jgi:hypothetical protein